MKNSLQNFYKEFYGPKFYRYFRRPHQFKKNRNFRIEFTVTNASALSYHVKTNNGKYPCMISVYDLNSKNSKNNFLKCPNSIKNSNNPIKVIDRIFMDFDTSIQKYKPLKREFEDLREHEIDYKKQKQLEIKKKLLKLVICDHIAEPAINDVKKFAKIFKRDFGIYPALFFSGFKGAHAYCFFEPLKLSNTNKTINYVAEKIKNTYNLSNMDLAVNKDATTRLSRIPYSRHQITGLTVVPFKPDEQYLDIIKKSINPSIEPFNYKNHFCNLNEYLLEIDEILEHNQNITANKNKINIPNPLKVSDHRDFFNKIIGNPVRIYKYYSMYHCPFPDHSDNKPSFKVTKKGYSCYGCGRWGNYWQFYKDYYGWTDHQVREYLKNKRGI